MNKPIDKILERFDEEFVFETEKDGGWCYMKTANPDDIKTFLRKELSSLIREEREDILDKVDTLLEYGRLDRNNYILDMEDWKVFVRKNLQKK